MLRNLIFSILISFSVARWLLNSEETVEALKTPTTCKAYTCKTIDVTIPTGSCGILSNSTVNLKPCSTASNNTYCDPTTFICTTPPTSSLQNYPGEPCYAQSDCKFGTCTSGTCKGQIKGTTCSLNEQCDPGLRCSAGGVCVSLIGVGLSGCRDYADCVNWASCNITYTSSNGTCIQYASVANGQIVTDCENGWSELCTSGYCIKDGSWFGSIGTCATAPVSINNLPYNCTVNTECLGTDGTNMMLSSCACGYNNLATSYCMPFIGDPIGVALISSWVTALKASGACNTVRRDSTSCLTMIGKYGDTVSSDFLFRNYSQVINNDICVKAIYTYEYSGWISSSLSIALSIALIFILI